MRGTAGDSRLRARLCIAAAIAVLGIVLHSVYDLGRAVTDIDVVLYAARDVLAGISPYDGVGPAREWSFYYPLVAAVAFVPLAGIPVDATHLLLVAAASGLLGWGIARDRPTLLPIFFSAAYLQSVLHVQWPPILMTAVFFPGLAWLYVLKPHSGLALFLAYPSARSTRVVALGGAGLLIASFVLQPSWPVEWLARVGDTSHFQAAVMHPGGAVLLLGLLRWRRPEARLLVMLAIIPRTAALYEMLFLFLIPRTHRESWALVAASWMLLVWHQHVLASFPGGGALAFARLELGALVLMYGPALLMILRRPNEGAVPRGAGEVVGGMMRLRIAVRSRPGAA